MKAHIQKACYILWMMIAVLFILLFSYFKVDITTARARENHSAITDYKSEVVQDSAAPTGIRNRYTFTLDGVEEGHCELVFYCIHQNANVYLEENCVYSMQMHETGISGKSAGYVWNTVAFSKEDNGKELTIEIVPVYKSSNEIVPIIYFGNKYDIARRIILDNGWNLIFSMVVIVIGGIYIFFVIYNNRKTSVETNLAMLGFFSVQLGLWRISESEAVNFLFPGRPLLAQLTFVFLMFMALSLVLYVKDLYSTKNNFIWYVPCILGFINIVLTLLLQYVGIADMRQMLPMTHIVIGVIALVTIVMTVYEIRFVGWNDKLKRTILCLGICFVGMGLDMLFYYVTSGSAPSVFGMVGFLIYILVLGVGSMQEVKELMQFGIKAKKYEQLAYHDQLTGLFNRTAYEEFTQSDGFNPEKCTVIIMDLNNLKGCNDNLGHDKGDIYIKETATMIKEVFGDLGNCYRMGGDEFYVLMGNISESICRKKVGLLQEKVASCAAVGNGFKMGIACGFETFDKRMDLDIGETARRADKAMYQDKFHMKKETVSNLK